MFLVSKVIIRSREDIKSIAKFSDNEVVQVLGYLPKDVIIDQSCYIFFNSNFIRFSRVKNNAMIFLMLLTSTSQVKDAINASGVSLDGENYIIKCRKCFTEGKHREMHLSIEDRLHLTFNAITFT